MNLAKKNLKERRISSIISKMCLDVSAVNTASGAAHTTHGRSTKSFTAEVSLQGWVWIIVSPVGAEFVSSDGAFEGPSLGFGGCKGAEVLVGI